MRGLYTTRLWRQPSEPGPYLICQMPSSHRFQIIIINKSSVANRRMICNVHVMMRASEEVMKRLFARTMFRLLLARVGQEQGPVRAACPPFSRTGFVAVAVGRQTRTRAIALSLLSHFFFLLSFACTSIPGPFFIPRPHRRKHASSSQHPHAASIHPPEQQEPTVLVSPSSTAPKSLPRVPSAPLVILSMDKSLHVTGILIYRHQRSSTEILLVNDSFNHKRHWTGPKGRVIGDEDELKYVAAVTSISIAPDVQCDICSWIIAF